MILPKKLAQNKPAPKNKYEDASKVKMFLLSLEDLHTNRFKNGWFTLYKFVEQVKENPALKAEMQEFSKVKIEKPVVEGYYVRPAPELKQAVKKKQAFVRRNLQIGAEEESKDETTKNETLVEVKEEIRILG